MDPSKPLMSLLCQIPGNPDDFGGGTVLCSFCKTRRVSSLEELKAHIAWEHLSYTPYQCIHCENLHRPTDVAIRLHFGECHPGQPIKMIFSPDKEIETKLELEVKESLRQKRNEQHHQTASLPTRSTSNSILDSGPVVSPAPSSSSSCSRTSELDEVREACFGEKIRNPVSERMGRKRCLGPWAKILELTEQNQEEGVSTVAEGPVVKQEVLEGAADHQATVITSKRGLVPDLEISNPTHISLDPAVTDEGPLRKKKRDSSEGGEELGRLKQNFVSSQLVDRKRWSRWQESKPSYLVSDEAHDDLALFFAKESMKDHSSFMVKEEEEEQTILDCFTSNQEDWNQPKPLGLKARGRQCQICGKIETCKFSRHVMVHHMRKPVGLCLYCSYSCTGDFSTLQAHVKARHKDKPFTWSDKRGDFEAEIRELLFKCFPSMLELEQRKLRRSMMKKQKFEKSLEKADTVEKEKKFAVCKLCSISVRHDSRKRHVTSCHFGKPVFFCGYCSLSFNRKDYCWVHLRSRHPGKIMKYRSEMEKYDPEIEELIIHCFGDSSQVVSSELSNQDLLVPDSVSSSTSKNFKVSCYECKAEMWNCHKLFHIRKHMQIKPYFCSKCGMGFPRKQDCAEHVKIAHDEVAKMLDRTGTSDYSDELNTWRVRCFPTLDNTASEPSLVSIEANPMQAQTVPSRTKDMQTPHPSAVKIFCKKCQIEIWQADQLCHIFEVHMKRNVYFCNYCDFGTVQKGNCYKHVHDSHRGLPLKIVDNTEECLQDAEFWKSQCFDCSSKETTVEDSVLCQECKIVVRKSHKLQHILLQHIGSKMYFCSYCGLGTVDKDDCYKHVKSLHYQLSSSCEVLDRTGDHSAEIELWKNRCFSNHQTEETALQLKSEETALQLKSEETALQLKSELNPDEDSTLDSLSGSFGALIKAQEVDSLSFCHVCKNGAPVRSSEKIEHVCINHLKKDVFFCWLCDYTNSGSEKLCWQHIKEAHPDATVESSFRSDLKKYQIDIESLVRLCFSEACKPSESKLPWCGVCKRSLDGDGDMDHHILMEHLKKPIYSCIYCSYSNYGNQSDCIIHIREEHPAEELKFKSDLEQHRAELRELKAICFEIRDKTAQNSSEVNQPELELNIEMSHRMEPEQSQTCQLCEGKGRKVREQRLPHILSYHLRNCVYFCGYCDKGTVSLEKIRSHIQDVHPGKPLKMRDLTTSGPVRSRIENYMRLCYPLQRESAEMKD